MTDPAPETIEREHDKLYVTDAELIRRLGVPEKVMRATLREFDRRAFGFPRKEKMFGNRRYWPAVTLVSHSVGGEQQEAAGSGKRQQD